MSFLDYEGILVKSNVEVSNLQPIHALVARQFPGPGMEVEF